MSTAEVLEEFFFVNETSGTIGLMRRLDTNAQFGVIEIDAVQFEKTDQHVTEIGMFHSTGVATGRATAAAAADAIVEMIIIEITVIVAATVVIVG